MNAHKETSVVHHYADCEIMDVVLNSYSNNESDEDNSDRVNTDVAESLTMDKLIELADGLISGLEQCAFMTEEVQMTLFGV